MSNSEQADALAGPTSICKRCSQGEATQQIRIEKVCIDCFTQYIRTKAIKRMETYRVRNLKNAPRRLLLPISYGPCSASLLHILDAHLQGQYDRMNRGAYELYVVHVDLYLDSVERESSLSRLENFKSQFPRHTFSRVGIEDALLLGSIDWAALNLPTPAADTHKTEIEAFQELIGSMPSATSKTDIVTTLLSRLLVGVAKKNRCESILFGDSTTRLAEKTLTETAKGRGFSLPWQVSDGMSPFGVGFNYPLRDLLKKELLAFSSIATPSLTDLVIVQPSAQISASSKLTTIDDLMAQYFESVEQNYPSIVANVVRTSSKLKPLTVEEETECGLCGLPVAEGTDGIFGWGGDQNTNSRPEALSDRYGVLCYGCSRSING